MMMVILRHQGNVDTIRYFQPTKFFEGIRNYGEQENGCLNGVSLPFFRHNEYSEAEKFCELVAGA